MQNDSVLKKGRWTSYISAPGPYQKKMRIASIVAHYSGYMNDAKARPMGSVLALPAQRAEHANSRSISCEPVEMDQWCWR
jgi:hypothetical protein